MLKNKINKLKTEKEALRKRNSTRKVSDSIEKKVEEVLIDIRPEKKKEVKKQLMFSETWITEKKPYTVRNGVQKLKIVSVKNKCEDYPRNVINKLESTLISFFKHNLNITVQYEVIKHLKQNLNANEILLHIDFSENYCLKYNQEIQSFHFGGSREQVSLHTGIIYYKDSEAGTFKTKSFCTMSKCLKHDARSIWAHLCPILKLSQTLVPFNTVHFLSDSPSSQYRNKNIFYMITKLKELNPNIIKVTWNYQEAGHGKGAPDGIGAVVKRTADNFVKYGGDVGSFEDFTALVIDKIQNIHFEIITENDIIEKEIPLNIPAFKGTMDVHQVIWTTLDDKQLAFRSLSCFECQDCNIPCKHNKHLGFLRCNEYGKNEVEQSGVHCDKNEATNVNADPSILHINTPTILNNITDSDDLENLPLLEDLIEFNISPLTNVASSSSAPRSPKVKILSDVRLSWENRKFYKRPNKRLVLPMRPKNLAASFNTDHRHFVFPPIKSENQNKYVIDVNESDDDSDELNIF
ncbi:uncharacterized protein [Maniola hyperantus]|uniref:uncharacterized protein n=1 Tax=Aphantopus hyperantus TaxID=2795564 RepID=UPI00374A3C77